MPPPEPSPGGRYPEEKVVLPLTRIPNLRRDAMNDARSRYDSALEQAITTLGADSGTIHIKESGRTALQLAASRDIPDVVLQAVRAVPWGRGMAGVAADRGAPVTYSNIQTCQTPDVPPRARATGVKGALVVPMIRGTEVVGTIGVGCRRERTFSAAEIAWLMRFGRQLASELGEMRKAA
jgi:GAF domain-containing protein